MNNLASMQAKILELQNKVILLETILNNIGGFIYAKDREGNYTFANQAVLELFALNEHQVIGYDDSHFFDLERSNQLKRNDDIVMEQGVTIEEEEQNLVRASGEMRVYNSVKTPITDSAGNIVGICGISTDITDEKGLQQTVKEQKQLLDTVLDNVDAHVYMKDINREFLYVNHKTAALFGRSADDIIGQLETNILPHDIAEHFHQSDSQVFATNEKQIINEEFTDDEGNTKHYLSVKVPLNREGKPPALIGFSSDVTELFKLKERFKEQANTDSLTTLYNRRFFMEYSEQVFQRAQRLNGDLSLISLDIDHFKAINDRFGHPVGDTVLIAIAEKLSNLLRSEDIIARMGGEEFSILLPDAAIKRAVAVAERLRTEIERSSWPNGVSVTISLGVTSLNTDDSHFDHFFSRTDKALYRAKERGRNCVSE